MSIIELPEKVHNVFRELHISCAYDMPRFWYNGGKDYKVIPTKYHNGYQKALEDAEREIKRILDIECYLPTVSEQRWIPVTGRLPEVGENVLVFIHYAGEPEFIEFFPPHDGITISHWTGVKNHNIPKFGDLGENSTVLAWMPLPEPYRPEGGEADV